MKRRLNSKLRLVRLSDAFLPAALLAATLLQRGDLCIRLFAAFFLIQMLSFASAYGVRAAFAEQPSMRYVRGSVLTALLLQIAGTGVALAGHALLSGLSRDIWILYGCGCLLNIEHTFYEYLFTLGDKRSSVITHGISCLLILVGLLLSAQPGERSVDSWNLNLLLIASALATLSNLVIAFAMGDGLIRHLNLKVLSGAPLSLLHALFYPALGFAASLALPLPHETYAPFFACLLLYELCRTPFRRKIAFETRPLNGALCAIAGICAVLLGISFIPAVSGAIPAKEFPLLAEIPYFCALAILTCAGIFALFGGTGRGE